MSEVQRIEAVYQPRALQKVLHAKLKRFNVLVCHRRFGKTVFSINEMIDQALRCERHNPQMAYIGVTYGSVERVAWDMLKQYTKHIPGVVYNEAKLTCKIPRKHKNDMAKILLLGSENPDSLRGIYLDGAILDEYASQDPRIWGEVIRPALSDRMGWAIFIGTPYGQNHFYDVYRVAQENKASNWYHALLKASQTNIIPPEELLAMRAEMSEDEYEQELECSFTAALSGAYWGKAIAEAEAKGRMTKVPHDENLQVETFWDLGVSDTTAVWFTQVSRHEVRVIDYFEATGMGIPDLVKVMHREHRAKYNYKEHHWPHDGNSRDFSTGVERSVTARGLGLKPLRVHQRYDVADSIDAGRRIFSKCWFDVESCTRMLAGDKTPRGIESLKNYQRRYDTKQKVYADSPMHNWASHGSDAWRLLGMALRTGERRSLEGNTLPRQTSHEYDIFSV